MNETTSEDLNSLLGEDDIPGSGDPVEPVQESTDPGAEVEAKTNGGDEPKEAQRFMAGIARGRMAAPLVYVIKFITEGSDSELASRFVTTPGKINDIKKDRNFKYITEDLKFTATEITEAKDKFKASVNADNSTVPADSRDKIVEVANIELNKLLEIGTVGESQLADVRKSTRKPRGQTAPTGVGETDKPQEAGGQSADSDEAEAELDSLLED